MRKQERALETVRLLEEEYPIAKCSLDYDDAWKLLVSVRLAAQSSTYKYACSNICMERYLIKS